MMSRKHLPDRRRSEILELELHGLRYTASFSCFADGGVAEVFLQNHKPGSQSDANARDAAVAASLALQFGCPLETLQRAVLRDENGNASTPLGAALDLIAADRGGQAVKILGVDPGIHGGLAIVVIDDGAAPQLVDAIDIPVAGVGAKERVDVLASACLARHPSTAARVNRTRASDAETRSFDRASNTDVPPAQSRRSSRAVQFRRRSSSRQPGKNSTGFAEARRNLDANARSSSFSPPTRCSPARKITVALRRR